MVAVPLPETLGMPLAGTPPNCANAPAAENARIIRAIEVITMERVMGSGFGVQGSGFGVQDKRPMRRQRFMRAAPRAYPPAVKRRFRLRVAEP
jgi:hypothetical protein